MIIKEPTIRDLRIFGLGLGVLLGLFFSGISYYKGGTLYVYLFPLGVVAAITGLVYPPALVWIYKPWMKVAGIIGWINTRLIMMSIFYFVVTPIGLIMRLLGNDMLDRKIDRSAATYWLDYSPSSDKDRYEKQF